MITTKKLAKKREVGYKEVYDISMNINENYFPLREPNFIVENTVVHNSHAGGFIVASDSLFENIPVVKSSKNWVSGWQESGAVKELEALGFIKIDVLGLAAVEQIRQSVKEINRRYPNNNLPEDIYNVPVDDKNVYDFINTLELDNVFQMESKVFVEAVRKIKPQTLSDISNISTLIRPGAACSVDVYAKSEMSKTKTPRCLWNVFDHTRGWLTYQEQLMQVLQELGGFDIFKSDKVRRLVRKIGKGKTSEENRQAMLEEAEKYHTEYLKHAIPKIQDEDGWSEKDSKKYAEDQWKALMGQAKYCLEENELIKLANGKKKRVKHLKIGDEVIAYTNGEVRAEPVVQKHNNGMQTVYEVVTNKGTKIKCTGNHKFLTKYGKKTLLEIWENDLEILERSDFELKIF